MRSTNLLGNHTCRYHLFCFRLLADTLTIYLVERDCLERGKYIYCEDVDAVNFAGAMDSHFGDARSDVQLKS